VTVSVKLGRDITVTMHSAQYQQQVNGSDKNHMPSPPAARVPQRGAQLEWLARYLEHDTARATQFETCFLVQEPTVGASDPTKARITAVHSVNASA